MAGFSGVVVALDKAPVRSWPQHRREGLRTLLQVNGVVIVFSIAPMILGRRAPEPDLWTWALAAYGVGHVADVLSFLLRQTHETPTSAKVGAWIGLAIALTQIALAAAVSPTTAEMVYLIVLTWHLAISAGSFVYLLYTHDAESVS